MRAELIADCGRGAASDDFFRSPGFLEAEQVTHTLAVASADGLFVAPVIAREIEGADGALDAISPYGYPGILAAGGPGESGAGTRGRLDPDAVDWAPTGLVTIFLRHRLGVEPPVLGATERAAVHISDPGLPRKSRMSDRQQIRKNLKAGLSVRQVHGPESTPNEREGFRRAYEQTMDRTGAAARYYFDRAYFDLILASPLSWLFLAETTAGEVAAASIAVTSDGMAHYYLSGTGDEHLRGAPMKNILAEMTDFAWERDMALNLGGGITPGDHLDEFKRGFANRQETWRTSEIVCDRAAYEGLTAGRGEAGDFFPAYRYAG